VTTRVPLKRLLHRQEGAEALLATVSEALARPVAIEDADGRAVFGPAGASTGGVPVTVDEQVLGWVRGEDRDAAALAAVVRHVAARDAEQKALGAEVLHLYREINLIYSFSEKLAALLDVHRVAQLTLQQARHLIVATDGIVLLLDEETGELGTLAGFGDELPAMRGFRRGEGITGAVVASGIGEVVNDVDADARRTISHTAIKALICAPLKVGEKVIGVIALGSTMPMQYTAAELKLVNTLGLQSATAIENARLFERTVEAARERERLQELHQAAELARTKLESELTLASRIQQNLFPSELPAVDGYELAARNRPARRCGGDYYDALPTWSADREPRLLVCVADVSGKGLPAALVMSNMQATLRALLGRIPGLPQLAGHASELIYAATSPEKYVTAALAEVAPDSGVLRFVGAGHLDNVIIRANGEMTLLASTGAPLGLMSPGLPFTETRDILNAGDMLALYSDGLTDAQNAEGEEFGEARLHELLRSLAGQSADAIVDRVLASLEAFVNDTPQFDDMTILVLRRL
jgi:serine phosphatase RsbU (regulator of sigma subunit)/putative methionine-R-sulfoxide reductase with GAF domain